MVIKIHSDNCVPYPYFEYLHGLCYELAGDDYPHEENKPPAFHPFIVEWEANYHHGTFAVIEISSLNEHLTNQMIRNIRNTKTLHLGNEDYKIVYFSIKKQENIPIVLNHYQHKIANEFKLSFVTPTRFLSREQTNENYDSIAFPDLTYFIRSIAIYLHKLFNVRITLKSQDELINDLKITQVLANPIKIKVYSDEDEIDGFIGYVQLSTKDLSEKSKNLLSFLLKIAKYSGVGHKRGYGMGHIQVLRPESK